MHVRGGSQWQSRRKTSLGPLRRAHPASGATWNVQVVRGKMTSRCLWHACRALVLGIVLMLVGGGMATVGYYANNFPSLSDLKSNSTSTIRVRNEQRGLHLNNLSYVGPIIMGVGGFIVVASCVMTFEARDSAAKVVPARFKLSGNARTTNRNAASRRSTSVSNGPASLGSQNARWEQHLGVFRTSPAVEQVMPDRKALTAALVHFSRALGTPKATKTCESRRVSRSGSVPNLTDKLTVPLVSGGSPSNRARTTVRPSRGTRVSSMVQRSTRETNGSLLHPAMLQLHRHAQSVDEPEPFPKNLNQTGSHGSMHYGYQYDMPVVHKLRDRTKRSDTARRHVLSRQTKIEKEDPGSPKQNPFAAVSRRSSTISNASSTKLTKSSRRASTISKTPSVDSRGASASTMEVTNQSPERSLLAMTTTTTTMPRKGNISCGMMAQMSTPSVEKECRSQLSICSEPPLMAPRNLSCQSSLEPCVPEEDSPDLEHPEEAAQSKAITGANDSLPSRPDSLVLGSGTSKGATHHQQKSTQSDRTPNSSGATAKFLYRSNSTKSFRKPKPKIKSKKLSNEFDQIYVISSNESSAGQQQLKGCGQSGSGRYPNFYHTGDDEFYDSIEVIHERRSKNFSKFSAANTPTGEQRADELAQEGGAGDQFKLQPQTAKRPDGGGGVEGPSMKTTKVSADELCPVGESLGSNKFSVVADISPMMALSNFPASPEKLLQQPEIAATKTLAIGSSGEGGTDLEEDEEPAKSADHNNSSSIQRYDTVIYNAAASSVESEDSNPMVNPLAEKMGSRLNSKGSAEGAGSDESALLPLMEHPG
ncbi:serine-rich adhesin for platelets [Uranotaenia lowii]|uniref:serine-rich adhesin for platelets n=1 Tax=Uranotaenia lowii TaxID=190385 RepID=UPI00247AA727|nr:serine-rich adhesin for platelets [Uranotaenia lowii]XP_055601813.1 serine-rich adhesin for platelets [Uranotaenia lowii]XP_055601814.1 serine-rich adhesin for platelets [Uranotaenia lowii]XP_055601815.1 serine-rich adhesin for platelets [Uranotaenia lowii]XP_055601816.1 serine-rich adhesin for platelets [Uranotaenia lowii]XP_055601817.1 serine-rich adhesin for platelets [Uranotaenia lowii]XP_055601818.1 serine-rich adhesin for platelets [Uranotaenia lowii]